MKNYDIAKAYYRTQIGRLISLTFPGFITNYTHYYPKDILFTCALAYLVNFPGIVAELEIQRYRRDTLEFQHWRKIFNYIYTIVTAFIAFLIIQCFLSTKDAFAIGVVCFLPKLFADYYMWKVVNEDFIKRMKKRAKKMMNSLKNSVTRQSPALAGA